MRNLADTLERLFDRQPASLCAATAAAPAPIETVTPEPETAFSTEAQPQAPTPGRPERSTHSELRRQQRRAKRLERFETVCQLQQQGVGQHSIARQLHIGPATIRRYAHASTFPEIAQRRQMPSILDPFMTYLTERWRAGCHNGCQLWREISARGYTGSRTLLSRWVTQQRRRLPTRATLNTPGQGPPPIRLPAGRLSRAHVAGETQRRASRHRRALL